MAKTSIISIIIFFSFNCLTSQDIGIGTTWVYNQGSFFPNSSIPDITELKIIADTIINGKTFYVLEGHCLCSEEDPLILRWENQKIYNYFNDTEHIFYDFNLQAGDSLKVKFPTYDTSYTTLVLIDSVSSLNNRILQHVTVPFIMDEFQHTDWDGVFIEDFGSLLWCLTPQFNLCEIGTGGLCHVINPLGDTIRFTEEFSCGISSVQEQTYDEVLIYPNPTYNEWSISNLTLVDIISLYDTHGRLIKQVDLNGRTQVTLNGNDLKNGIYPLKLMGQDGTRTILLSKY